MVLRRHLGSPSPAQFYHLFKTLAEPHLLFACELGVGCPKYILNRIDDLQVKVARYALGVPSSTNRLLCVTDLGAVPLSDRLTQITLRFLHYAMSLPRHRLVRIAIISSMELSRSDSQGWFWQLKKKLVA
ncbi:hypothetical protein DFH27DRAFT_476089, partial [Peziza echinospora]